MTNENANDEPSPGKKATGERTPGRKPKGNKYKQKKPDHEFMPTAAIDTLRTRAQIIRRVRNFFDSRGYFHVETPVLSRDVVVDRYLDPVHVNGQAVDPAMDQSSRMFLQTSPEFAMKRLVASGADSIYQIGPVFRRGEIGSVHNPEFTMLEWYQIDQTPDETMNFIGELVTDVTGIEGTNAITYASVFQDHLGIDPHKASAAELALLAAKHNIEFSGTHDESTNDTPEAARDEWLNLLLTHVIEPNLGTPDPVIIYDWPASQSALAKVRDADPPVAERFELYINGIELANGYHELLDADELARRNEVNNSQRVLDGNTQLPGDSRLLEAMRHGLPECCGVALGIDRLVMVALGSNKISEVMAFPIERA